MPTRNSECRQTLSRPKGVAVPPYRDAITTSAFYRKPNRLIRVLSLLLLAWSALAPQPSLAEGRTVLRVGHFPNITHAQALVSRAMAREGKGWFESRLGPDVTLEWYVYNSGSGAMEAILARSLDLTYVGMSPTLNAYARMSGREIRVVAGACSGGAALLVQKDGPIHSDADFKGKTMGTPQLANTQDISARAWLQSVGHRVTLTGGDVMVIPSANPDLYSLFKKKELDAVWTVEPWVSRILQEAEARVYLEESSFWKSTGGRYATTLLVSSVKLLKEHQDVLSRFVAAHVALTDWINQHPQEAQVLVNKELIAQTTKGLKPDVPAYAWKRLEFTTDPILASVRTAAQQMKDLGFNRRPTDFSQLHDFTLLNELLRATNRPVIVP